ncbi:hypothetical protein OAP63_03875 [Vibrio sp.]|uniref:DUF2955 domain-containing protein n=1 Tax=Vibrio viridaestus TaxID=2487322 RepID=A0A3N9TKD6_9VIBR|nr:hypothetical protein [Vibrio viridaestus]MDC0609845.1 hypothetical protein [Vibrio sp.]RQW64720.1 hypothetical protein EES38_01345 [Vibrio viridaestus]
MYELTRKTLIIVSCLMLSKMLHLNVSVYIVLFAVVIANTCYSKHIWDIIKRILPSLLSALGAIVLNQLFAAHPFIIWTCTMIYFDHVRRHANTNLKVRMATLPLFMIIFINTYSNSTGFILSIPEISHDLILSTLIVGLVASFINHVMPVKANIVRPKPVEITVTGVDRLKLLCLVGFGLSFIMINEVTTAVFCLVPLITSAMQPSHSMMKNHSSDKMLSQVGGCSLAVIVSMFFSGTEINLFTYLFISYALVFTILLWCNHSDPIERPIHTDALMGFLIPYQLYIGKYGNDFGLNSIMLRAFELVVALLIIYVSAHWLEILSNRKLNRSID